MQTTAVTCGQCGYSSLTVNPFMTLSLQHKSSLDKCLTEYLGEIKIDGLYKCDRCHQQSKAKVQHNFVRLPRFLVFHIKRFDSMFNKIRSNTKYETLLDLDK